MEIEQEENISLQSDIEDIKVAEQNLMLRYQHDESIALAKADSEAYPCRRTLFHVNQGMEAYQAQVRSLRTQNGVERARERERERSMKKSG